MCHDSHKTHTSHFAEDVLCLVCLMEVEETPALYKAKVLPYIQQLPAEDKGWIYNILDKGVSSTLLITGIQGDEALNVRYFN